MPYRINHICEICLVHNSFEYVYCQNCHYDLVELVDKFPESHKEVFNNRKNASKTSGFIPGF